jgi:hypothetical protein
MKRLLAESYILLLWFELLMACRSLKSLHRQVQKAKIRESRAVPLAKAEVLSLSIDLACVFYPKRVLCLQRSAATTLLLRKYGIHAEMVIGAQMLPFKSHAWVEVAGVVVNDKPYMREIYQVLECL